jgi:hypothetical protein
VHLELSPAISAKKQAKTAMQQPVNSMAVERKVKFVFAIDHPASGSKVLGSDVYL